MPYVMNGQLVSIGSRQPLPGLRVEAWDKDVIHSDLLGSAVSDAEGRFTIRFDETHFRDHPKDHSPDVFFRVLEGERLVHTTETSIHRNLPPGTHSFVLEIALQSAPADRYVVSGQVQDSEDQPLPGLLVRVFDRDLRHEELLGEVLTDAKGRYELAYTQQQFRRAEKAQADLLVRVFGPSAGALEPLKQTHVPPAAELPTNVTELVASDIVFNASPRQTVDMTVDIYRHYGVSEYERYLHTLGPLFELEKVALHDLTDEDIRFLNGETGIPFEHLDYLRLDAQWSLRYKLDPAVFYGLFRQKLPTNLRRLLSEKPSRLLEVLNASLAGNIIPAALFARIKVILDSLRSLAVDLAFEPEADAEGSAPPIGAILATAPLAPELQRRVVDFALRHEGKESLWEALEKESGLDDDALSSARFTLESGALLLNHVPALQVIQKLSQDQNWTTTSDLARLKRSDWERIAADTAAKGLPKGFEGAEDYAEAIAYRVEQAFPTAVVAHRLAADEKLGDSNINFFFAANPSFDLLHTPVEKYIDNGADLGQVKDLDGLRGKLKTFQRVARLTPDRKRFDLMQGLLGKGYDSAIKIAATSPNEFLAHIVPIAGRPAAADIMVHAKARADAANLMLLNIRDYLADGIFVLPRATPTGELPTWAKLFGSLNTCACKHCRSVYSPAAYLVDMLEFLRKVCAREDAAGRCQMTLRDALFERRPDIANLLLDCDNANTPIPYIDLVNELLELIVADVAPTRWPQYQTKGSSVLDKLRLRAEPQHPPLSGAYERLNDASFPWAFPFSLDHERARAFSEHIGLELYRVKALFGQSEVEIAKSHLGIGDSIYTRITQAAPDEETLARYWGVPSRTDLAVRSLADLVRVPVLLGHSSLSYEDLDKLLTLNFFLHFELRIDRSDDPCDYENHIVAGVTEENRQTVFDRIHRFLRLQRALGWSIETLDIVLNAIGHDDIEPAPESPEERPEPRGTLVVLSKLIRLAKRLRLPVEQAASLNSFESLARAMRVPSVELQTLSDLVGSDPFAEPIPPSDPPADRIDAITRLLEHHDVVQSAGTDVAELAYVLRHKDVVPAIFEPIEATLDSYLRSLQRLLHGLRSELLAGLDARVEAARRKAEAELPPDTRATDRDRAIAAAEAAERAEALREMSLQLEAATVEHLAPYLALPADLTAALVSARRDAQGAVLDPALIHATDDDRAPAIADMLVIVEPGPFESRDGAAIAGDLFDRLTPQVKARARGLLKLLDKASRIVHALNLSAFDLRRLRSLLPTSGFLDFNTLPVRPIDSESAGSYEAWEMLARAKLLSAKLPPADRDLFDLLARAATDTDRAARLERVRANTGWDMDVLTALSDAMGFTDIAAFDRLDTYDRLERAHQWARFWRPNVGHFVRLGEGTVTEVSESLEAIARVQFPEEDHTDWYKALTPINDRLRERKRDALVAYLLANTPMRDGAPRWSNANALYADFLIDVDMSACQLTSRIAQANSTIQLFVQRCLMNLEPEVRLGDPGDSEHWNQWAWMKNYRVWEANRKVFLYPENWIEPDLRDDKSPFFKDLENELLQDDVTQESVERAYHNYLAKLDEVARLDVRGFYEEKREDGSKVLHVIARTYSEPHIYFYRKRNANRTWTSWENLGLSIEGDHIIPVVHNGRLMVFWVVFTENDSFWELSFHWSEQKGGWLSPRTSGSKPMIRLQLRDVHVGAGIQGFPESNFHFRTFVNEDVLEIELLTSYFAFTVSRETGSAGVFPTPRPYSIATFFFDECAQQLALKRTMDQVRFLELPPNTSPAYTQLHAQHSGLGIYTSLEERDTLHYGRLPQVFEPQQDEPPTITIGEYREAFESLAGDAVRLNIASTSPISVLQTNLEEFSVLPSHQNRQFVAYQSLFFRANNRTYFVSARQQPHVFARFGETSGDDELIRRRPGIWLDPLKYQFETFYHPYVCPIVEQLFKDGLDGVLAPPARSPAHALLNRQAGRERGRTRFRSYRPGGRYVWADLSDTHDVCPYEQFDFSLDGAYSIYNWELFFHIPLLVADRLSKNQRFEEAQRWFHYIFDPTNTSDPFIIRLDSPRAVYWRVKPFFERNSQMLCTGLG